MILRFACLGDYTAYARKIDACSRYSDQGHAWDLGVSGQASLDRCEKGDPSIVASYQDAADRFTAACGETYAMRDVDDVAGSRVVVPRYLAGEPACMRRRRKRESLTRHVGLYVSLVASGGIGADTMLARGKAILGLLDALTRAGIGVDLWLVADMQGTHGTSYAAPTPESDMVPDGDCTQVIRIETRPLDLSTMGHAIAHPAFVRNVTYAVGRNFGFHGGWSATANRTDVQRGGPAPGYETAMRAKLGMAPTDVWVPPVYYGDASVHEPEDWIRERVTQAMGVAA